MPRAAGAVLPRVGALVEGPAFHPYLNGRDNLLRLDAADRTVPGRASRARVDAALERVGLAAAAGKRYRKYSLGMRQRLGLAAALLRPRDLLVLDEPTNGLDPQGTREVRHLLREASQRGGDGLRVVAPAQRDRADLHRRRRDEPRQAGLPGLAARAARRGRCARAGGDVAAAGRRRGARSAGHRAAGAAARRCGGRAGRRCRASGSTAELVAYNVDVRQLVVERPDLEDLFVALTGEGFDVDE